MKNLVEIQNEAFFIQINCEKYYTCSMILCFLLFKKWHLLHSHLGRDHEVGVLQACPSPSTPHAQSQHGNVAAQRSASKRGLGSIMSHYSVASGETCFNKLKGNYLSRSRKSEKNAVSNVVEC